MSVQTSADRIIQNVANTYAVLSALGADMPAEQNSDNLAETAGTTKAVLYSEQTLTDEQKAQARENIGAVSPDEVPEGFSGSWNDLTDKPSTFTPSAHDHAWGEITDKPSTFTPASHNQAASTITSGTFAGQVVANSSGQAAASYVVRNSKLAAAEEAPAVNGQICWKYE